MRNRAGHASFDQADKGPKPSPPSLCWPTEYIYSIVLAGGPSLIASTPGSGGRDASGFLRPLLLVTADQRSESSGTEIRGEWGPPP
jgi:hypothetical protein